MKDLTSKDKEHSNVLLETQQRIKELEREQNKFYNPLDICEPGWWEDLRHKSVIGILCNDSWLYRVFHSFESRLARAVYRADMLVAVMQSQAEKTGKAQASKIEWIKEEILRLQETLNRLQLQKA